MTLDNQRVQFSRQRFLAMPLAGTIAWVLIATASWFLPLQGKLLAVYIGTGCIVYLGLFLSKFTGEDFLDKSKPKNTFDGLFMLTVGQALLIFAIAIPFALIEPTSLPLSVGILTGVMWLPLSWIIQHWIGFFHAITRTLGIVAVWYLFPEARFVAIPVVIVAVYAVSMVVLEARWRKASMLPTGV